MYALAEEIVNGNANTSKKGKRDVTSMEAIPNIPSDSKHDIETTSIESAAIGTASIESAVSEPVAIEPAASETAASEPADSETAANEEAPSS